MGKDERGCVKVPFGGYLKVPDDKKFILRPFFSALEPEKWQNRMIF